MIKSIVKYLMYGVFFIISLMLFFPKENLYFFVEKKLLEKKIVISDEQVESKLFSFIVSNADVYYEGIKFSKVKTVDIDTYLFVNSINIKKIKISDGFKSFVPQNIDNIKLKYSVLNPMIIEIISTGEFGSLSGNINVLDRTIIVYLKASNKMKNKYKNILKQMKPEEGEYTYEYKF